MQSPRVQVRLHLELEQEIERQSYIGMKERVMGKALANQSAIEFEQMPCTGIDRRIEYYVTANDSLALSQPSLLQHSQLALMTFEWVRFQMMRDDFAEKERGGIRKKRVSL
jgi:hypothetical protein